LIKGAKNVVQLRPQKWFLKNSNLWRGVIRMTTPESALASILMAI